MSYSPQGSPSQNGYPPSAKPGGGYGGEEDPPQRGKSRHQKHHQQQQQPSPGRVLPENNDPDKQSSHQNSHHHQQQQSIQLRVPSSGFHQKDHPGSHSSLPGQPQEQQPPGVLSQGFHPKDNDFSNHQSPDQSHKQFISIQDSSSTRRLPCESSSKIQQELRNPSESSVEDPMDPPKSPNLKSSGLPVKNHGGKHLSEANNKLKLQPVSSETNSKADQKKNSHALKEHINGYEQKPDPQPQLPEGGPVQSWQPLPVPDGYPPPRPPTSPSKLEPRKKGLLEKICCCFFVRNGNLKF